MSENQLPPVKNEAQIEQLIQELDLNDIRLTPAMVDAAIDSYSFQVLPGTLVTLCTMKLKKGAIVTGESHVISPSNFKEKVGQEVSYKNAREKIWELEGYLLRQRVYDHLNGGVTLHPSLETQEPGPSVLQIAKVCHAVNRAYSRCVDLRVTEVWDECTTEHKNSIVAGVNFRIAKPEVTGEEAHNSWMEQKLQEGWTYGKEKDSAMKRHPCLLPYLHLPLEQRLKDDLFSAVVKSMLDR